MQTVRFLILSSFSVFVMAGCTQQSDSHTAEVSSAQEVESISASATEYSIDTSASQLNWNGYKPTGKHYGTVGIDEGAIAVENNQVVGGSFTIDLNDIDVQDLQGEDRQKLTGHLKSEDFFHTADYPAARFEITSLKSYSGGATASEEEGNKAVVVNQEEIQDYKIDNPTHMVTGNLTMRDTTLSISFPAEITVTDEYVEAQAKFNIDRTKWNVSYNDESDPVRVAQDKFIYNTVDIGFDIVASRNNQPAS